MEQSCCGGREATAISAWRWISRLLHCIQELTARSKQRIAEWGEITNSVRKKDSVYSAALYVIEIMHGKTLLLLLCLKDKYQYFYFSAVFCSVHPFRWRRPRLSRSRWRRSFLSAGGGGPPLRSSRTCCSPGSSTRTGWTASTEPSQRWSCEPPACWGFPPILNRLLPPHSASGCRRCTLATTGPVVVHALLRTSS